MSGVSGVERSRLAATDLSFTSTLSLLRVLDYQENHDVMLASVDNSTCLNNHDLLVAGAPHDMLTVLCVSAQ